MDSILHSQPSLPLLVDKAVSFHLLTQIKSTPFGKKVDCFHVQPHIGKTTFLVTWAGMMKVGDRWEKSQEDYRLPLYLLKALPAFQEETFLNLFLPLLYFYWPEIFVFNNVVQFYTCFFTTRKLQTASRCCKWKVSCFSLPILKTVYFCLLKFLNCSLTKTIFLSFPLVLWTYFEIFGY